MTSLEDILKARDLRVKTQKELVSSFGKPLVSFTVNMPGPEKKNETSRKIFDAGVLALREKLAPDIVYYKLSDEETGYEGFFVADITARELKKKTCDVEETHPLGRLFDMDVIDEDMRHISREELGLPKRKCLICEREASFCARSRTHGVDELIKKINETVDAWENAR